ncbi:MAG: phosphatidyl-myo-inositol dimannoside synthase [Actinomycetota bacterium]|nr:phosphatidyl-myo-inositol dimannoside synthase [Actinomycetota bacterium]
MTALLVTNDFPPKIGGIQSYLYELWRRLPVEDATVLTTRHAGDAAWDAQQPFRVVRAAERQLFPTPSLARRIDALAREIGADVIFLDPWLPLGQLGPRLAAAPYVTIVHGAEVTVPGRVPGTRGLGRRVLRGAAGVVAAGRYPAREAERAAGVALRGVIVPPGVDVGRFRPLDAEGRAGTRRAFGLDPARPLVLGVSRLVPRKGFDVLIDAVAGLPDVQLAIAGAGRDRHRLDARARRRGVTDRVCFLGRVPDDDSFPRLYASADVFAMPCRDRWGGLEAEGFGIVFLEAAAAGVPSVAGRSGGSHEAVVDGETGFVVESRAEDVRAALGAVLADDRLRERMGVAARARAVDHFSYDGLVVRLAPIAAGDLAGLRDLGGLGNLA